MNCPCRQFLAGAGFPLDQNGGGGWRNLPDQFGNLGGFRIVTDDHLFTKLLIQFAGDKFVLLQQNSAIFFYFSQVIGQTHADVGKTLENSDRMLAAGGIAAGPAVQLISLAEFTGAVQDFANILRFWRRQFSELVVKTAFKIVRRCGCPVVGCGAIGDLTAVVANDEIAFVEMGQFTVFGWPVKAAAIAEAQVCVAGGYAPCGQIPDNFENLRLSSALTVSVSRKSVGISIARNGPPCR